ncbi:MAG TPA: MMPL family transporter [Bacillales bacterium]|nr:MMPL family transporter [Bacillales bacterium]
MKTLLKAKWLVIMAWIAALAVLFMTAPDLSGIVREQGQPKVPDGYPSSRATHLLEQMHQQNGSKKTKSTALVFYDKNGLTKADFREAKQAIQTLKQKKNKLGIESVTDSFDQPDLKDKLVSDDGTTLMASLEIHLGDSSAKQEKKQLYDTLKKIDLKHYFTGNWLIQDDYMASTQEGLHKTEWITVVFILAVLLFVFRSVVTPLIPLITVGITYLASQSVISFLVKWVDFPVSSFTQIFLVAVLFGIGTDYCILLLNRFKEEMPRHESVTEAVAHTYKNAGRTMLFSGISVLIGFSTIGLSTFSLYQSAVGVAIGVAVLMIALVTIVPIFMQVLGARLFWPSKNALGHSDSKLWGGIGKFALARPLISLLIVAAVTVPFILTYDNLKSYNSLEEIGGNYKSVKGFNLIADALGPGEAMPTTIVIKNDEKMNKRKYLETIESITREVKKVDHVKTVRSVTQPEGKPIKNFLVPNQAQSLSEGLADANNGIDKIANGLDKAQNQLADSQPKLQKAVNGFDPLISGTKDLKNGVIQLKQGLQKIENGLEDSSAGAAQLQNGLTQAKQGAEKLANQSQQLLNGYEQMRNGLSQLSGHYAKIQNGVQQMHDTLTGIDAKLEQLGKDHPEIQADKNYQYALGATKKLVDSTDQMSQNLKKLNQNLETITRKMNQANQGFGKLVDGQKQFANQLQDAVNGIAQLQNGLDQLANGQQKTIHNIPQITSGLDQVNNGQKQLKQGFSQLVDQLSQLTKGLGKSVSGLNKVSNGLEDARGFLKELSKTNSALSGFYIPDQALESKDFQQSMDAYMSDNRKITTLNVVFNVNPYSTTAINQIDDIQAAVDRAAKGTPLENAKVGIGGVTSTYHDLRGISNDDYSRTVLLMLVGIGLILIAFLRSFIMPIYILLSLVVTYFTAMGITEFIVVNLMGYSGVNWAVPFFGFAMLIALGVDYSIFLMDRFNENRQLAVSDAIHGAMKSMGTVIISAAIILGGTFGAMMPSGVMALVEIATIIISGLVIYNLFVLPLFIPVMAKMFGKANWWPFRRSDD